MEDGLWNSLSVCVWIRLLRPPVSVFASLNGYQCIFPYPFIYISVRICSLSALCLVSVRVCPCVYPSVCVHVPMYPSVSDQQSMCPSVFVAYPSVSVRQCIRPCFPSCLCICPYLSRIRPCLSMCVSVRVCPYAGVSGCVYPSVYPSVSDQQSMCPSVSVAYPSASVHLCIRPAVRECIRPCLPSCLCICPYLSRIHPCLSICVSVRLSNCLCIRPSVSISVLVCPVVYVSVLSVRVCPSVYPSLYQPITSDSYQITCSGSPLISVKRLTRYFRLSLIVFVFCTVRVVSKGRRQMTSARIYLSCYPLHRSSLISIPNATAYCIQTV
jgi:hypothetical protein